MWFSKWEQVLEESISEGKQWSKIKEWRDTGGQYYWGGKMFIYSGYSWYNKKRNKQTNKTLL